MSTLTRQAFEGLFFFLVAMALFLFVPAWTVHFWQAWVYISIVGTTIFLITVYLMRHDPALLQRRMGVGAIAEKERSQKIIQFIAQFAFIAIYIAPALDHRFGWSAVPLHAVVIADILSAFGLFIVFLVFRENTYTSATIEIAENQTVTTTGPYAWVRHPMYSGALMMLIATPVALGSWWGILAFFPMLFVIVWRLIEEEKFLTNSLHGYREYKEAVHSRLIPGVY